MASDGVPRSSVREGYPTFFVARLTIGTLNSVGQAVIHEPVEPPVHICDPYHANARGEKNKSIKRKLAQAAEWVEDLGPSK